MVRTLGYIVLCCIVMLHEGKALLYLAVSGLDVQNVSLGGGPVEGEVWHSVAEGKWRLAIGQTHDVHWHLEC